MRGARRGKRHSKFIGKKVVYVTQMRNSALEVQKMYRRKGERAEIAAEKDLSGAIVFVVYIFPRDFA
jgi:hypothetical protein